LSRASANWKGNEMYGPGGDPFDQFGGQSGDGSEYSYGDRLAGRIMAAEYNLAVQRNDAPQARNILARMLGQWLSNRYNR
jgi:hypothetical protein